ncbi:MAG: hypothetical protein KDC98_26320 [Planctomycetes bacterium]|nr:hypothetical protein [Planctomycetota bacterium]
MSPRTLPVLAALITATAAAQAQPHAVLLNPSGAGLMNMHLAQNGDTVHAAAITTAPALGFFHYARSLDGGRSWPLREVPIGHMLALDGLAVTGDHVHVFGHDQFGGPYIMNSHDAGFSWQPPLQVSQQTLLSSVAVLHADGNTLNMLWTETRTGGRAWANRSLDGGLTWQPADTALDAGLPQLATPPDHSMLLLGDGVVLNAFWVRNEAVPVVVQQRSLDGGANWRTQPVRLYAGFVMRGGGDGAVIMLLDATGALLGSRDHGASWTPIAGHGIGYVEDVAVSATTVLLVGRPRTNSTSPLLIQASTDGGLTWLPSPYSVPVYRLYEARAHAADALFVHVHYRDILMPNGSALQSDDGGVHWRLVTDQAGRDLHVAQDTAIALTKTGWNGLDHLAWVMAGHTTLGNGTAGTGGIAPELEGVGLPGLGRTFSLAVHRSRGGAAGLIGVAFAPPVNVPIGSATLYLTAPIVPVRFQTSGAPGTAGQGEFALPIAVPAAAGLVGMPFTSQAFVLDPVAAGGFTATGAVETWIR